MEVFGGNACQPAKSYYFCVQPLTCLRPDNIMEFGFYYRQDERSSYTGITQESQGDFEVFRPAEAIRCTDGHGGVDPISAGVEYGAPKLKMSCMSSQILKFGQILFFFSGFRPFPSGVDFADYGHPVEKGTPHAIIFLSGGFFFVLSSSFFLFFSPILSRRRLDVYHTSTHDMALMRI